MNKFKKGDKVKRIGCSHGQVFVGEIYTIKAYSVGALSLEEVGESYDPNLFELVPEPQYPNPPHKHRDLIIAWANGADIEYCALLGKWTDTKNPCWSLNTEYRIKPTKSAKDVEIEQIQAEIEKLKQRLENLKDE